MRDQISIEVSLYLSPNGCEFPPRPALKEPHIEPQSHRSGRGSPILTTDKFSLRRVGVVKKV